MLDADSIISGLIDTPARLDRQITSQLGFLVLQLCNGNSILFTGAVGYVGDAAVPGIAILCAITNGHIGLRCLTIRQIACRRARFGFRLCVIAEGDIAFVCLGTVAKGNRADAIGIGGFADHCDLVNCGICSVRRSRRVSKTKRRFTTEVATECTGRSCLCRSAGRRSILAPRISLVGESIPFCAL